MNFQYKIKKTNINNEEFFDELFNGWDGISDIKITEKGEKELNIFWLESLKKWDYSHNFSRNKSAKRTLKWLKENHPEILI